jgi:hypothetical protein
MIIQDWAGRSSGFEHIPWGTETRVSVWKSRRWVSGFQTYIWLVFSYEWIRGRPWPALAPRPYIDLLCIVFSKFSVGCTHLCRSRHVLAVLSSDPTSRVIPGVVIVKYIVCHIYLLFSGLALHIWYLYAKPHQEQWNIVKYIGSNACLSQPHFIVLLVYSIHDHWAFILLDCLLLWPYSYLALGRF